MSDRSRDIPPRVKPGDRLNADMLNMLVDAINKRDPRKAPLAGDSWEWVRCVSDDDADPFSIVEVYDGLLTHDGLTLYVRQAIEGAENLACNEEYPLIAGAGGWVKLVSDSYPCRVSVVPQGTAVVFNDLLFIDGFAVTPEAPVAGTGTGTGTGPGIVTPDFEIWTVHTDATSSNTEHIVMIMGARVTRVQQYISAETVRVAGPNDSGGLYDHCDFYLIRGGSVYTGRTYHIDQTRTYEIDTSLLNACVFPAPPGVLDNTSFLPKPANCVMAVKTRGSLVAVSGGLDYFRGVWWRAGMYVEPHISLTNGEVIPQLTASVVCSDEIGDQADCGVQVYNGALLIVDSCCPDTDALTGTGT